MKECPKCKELLGENVDRCFKCGYSFGSKSPGRVSQLTNRICPKCKKVYYSVSYTECPNCHVPMPLYSPEAKKLAEAEELRVETAASRDRALRKQEKFIEKFGLEGIEEKDLQSARWISSELFGNGLLEFATFFDHTEPEDRIMMSCLRALVEQNWILIRQLNKVNKQLEEVVKAVNTKPPQEI